MLSTLSSKVIRTRTSQRSDWYRTGTGLWNNLLKNTKYVKFKVCSFQGLGGRGRGFSFFPSHFVPPKPPLVPLVWTGLNRLVSVLNQLRTGLNWPPDPVQPLILRLKVWTSPDQLVLITLLSSAITTRTKIYRVSTNYRGYILYNCQYGSNKNNFSSFESFSITFTINSLSIILTIKCHNCF